MHKTQQSIQIQGGSKTSHGMSAAKYFSEQCMIPCIQSQIQSSIHTINDINEKLMNSPDDTTETVEETTLSSENHDDMQKIAIKCEECDNSILMNQLSLHCDGCDFFFSQRLY